MSTNDPNTSFEKANNSLADDLIYDFDGENKNAANSADEDFQRKYKAVFDDSTDSNKKTKVQVMNPEGGVSGVYDWIRCVIVAIAIVVFFLTFVFRLVEVDGSSMMDTLSNSDKVIVTKGNLSTTYTAAGGTLVVEYEDRTDSTSSSS